MKATDIKRGTVVEYQGKYWMIRDVERSAPTNITLAAQTIIHLQKL